MNEKDRKAKARTTWVEAYNLLGSVSKAAIKCGIARSTLYRWLNRAKNEKSLLDYSHRPKKLAHQKIDSELEKLILYARQNYRFGPQRIAVYLEREHDIHLSSSAIWRFLKKAAVKPLKRYLSPRKPKRYSREIPGERVQMDVTKIRPKCYQFTAVDDCTRLRVVRLYPAKTATNAVLFFHEVLNALPFPIQRLQTDWGTEFFNDALQEELMVHYVKFRPIKPRTPHLNGKIERSQKTDKAEFYSLLNLKDLSLPLEKLLSEWEHFYNHKRPHASLKGKTPYEKYLELEDKIPFQGDVTQAYWDSPPEEIVPRNSKYLAWIKEQKLSFLQSEM